MKSRNSSPQTSPQAVVRTIRVASGSPTAAAKKEPSLRKSSLRIEELSKMPAMNGFHPVSSTERGPSPSPSPSPAPGLLAPTTNGVSRKISADYAATPTRIDSLPNGVSTAISPSALSPTSATSENSPAPWSSAIGHATTTGKSGRVIEKLMTENDKLKRDLNEQLIKCQELEKSLSTCKPQMEALRQENDNLSHARGVDSSLIARRDRKIEEMKAELATERERRTNAERVARERESEKEDLKEHSKREMIRMEESTKHATLHAEILETSHKQLSAEYRARAEAWRTDLASLNEGREQDRQRINRLDVVTGHMRSEIERSRKINGDIGDAWERLRRENDARLQSIEDQNERDNARSKQLSEDMDRVVNEMRWLMGVKKNMKELDGQAQ